MGEIERRLAAIEKTARVDLARLDCAGLLAAVQQGEITAADVRAGRLSAQQMWWLVFGAEVMPRDPAEVERRLKAYLEERGINAAI